MKSTPSPRRAGVLIAAAIGLLAAQPYLFGQLINGSDTYYHLHRLWQLDVMMHQGVWFPRWSPDLAFGFGYPVFQFYGPLSYQIAEIFYGLTGQLITGYLIALALFAVITAVGAYLWARDILGEWGGLMTAAAYVFTPYLASNILIRGSSAEACAFAAMPFVLWSVHHIARRHTWFIAFGALAYAALALSHNATFFLFTPALLIYAAAISATSAAFIKQFLRILLMMALGLALAAFYLLPAFGERTLVQLDKLIGDPTLDFHNNFISLNLLFSNPFPFDAQALGYPYPLHIGLTTLLLGIFSVLVFMLSLMGASRMFKAAPSVYLLPHVLASLLIVGTCVFMMAPSAASVTVWESLPVLRVLQFQRRFLPIAGLFAALIVGLGCSVLWQWLKRPIFGIPITAAMLCAVWLTVLPLQQTPSPFSLGYAPTAQSIMRLEEDYGVIGTTTTGEYLPVAVKTIPPIELSPLLRAQSSRLDTASLLADVRITSEHYDALRYDLTLRASTAFSATFTTFYYAGWQALLDGVPANIQPSQPYGFITVVVPAGEHHLQIFFGSTPLRRVSEMISIVAALVLITCLATFILRSTMRQNQLQSPVLPPTRPASDSGISAKQALVLLAVLAVLFVFKSFVVDKQATPWAYTRFDGQAVSGLTHPANANFNNTLVFLGAELPTQAPSNGTLNANLYWRAARKLDSDYSVSLQLVGANGVIVGQSDHQHPANTPTRNWAQTQYARDTHELKIYPATPPGEYALRVSVYPYGVSDKPQPLVNASGVQAEVGRVQVLRPQTTINAQAVQPRNLINKPAVPAVLLLGYDAPETPARAGDRVPISLYWQASDTPASDLQFQFILTQPDASPSAAPSAPLVPGYATTQWQRGDVWRASHALLLPAKLTSGQYRLAVQVDGAAPIELGPLTVTAPEHVMAAPAVATPQTAKFGDLAELIGFDAAPTAKPGQPFEVKLVWKAIQETSTPYKVFVHLLNAQGNLVASDDAAPAQWQRPTTGWVSGEFISDAHVLNLPTELPAGQYTLQVGLYEDGGSNPRLGEPVKLQQVVDVKP